LFWPVLWEGPAFHFTSAMAEMSKYQWNDDILYRGSIITGTTVPWHYLLVWIAISTPIPYLLLFFVGLIFITKRLITQPLYFASHQKDQLLMMVCFFLPLIMIIVLKSVVYDGWRHVFFIYPSFILIALCGLKSLKDGLFKKNKFLLFILVGCAIVFNFSVMAGLHPYENVYFNRLAGKDMKEVKKNFELDYYGLSSKQALEYILKNDTSSKIMFNAKMEPQHLNIQFLPPDQRNRIDFTELEYADYFIAQYRARKQHYDFRDEVFSAKVGNASIISVFKLTASEKDSLSIKGKTIMKRFMDFENESPEWTSNSLYTPATGAHSGKQVTRINGKNAYSDGWTLHQLDSICNKKNLALKASFWKYENLGSVTNFVVSIDDQTGKNYFWAARDSKAFGATKEKWDKTRCTIPLPTIKSANDVIKIYIFNQGDQQVYIDDISLEFIEKEGKLSSDNRAGSSGN
jgi:hypothetical protein